MQGQDAKRCARSACLIPTQEIAGAFDAIKDKTELEALIAYLQGLGTALKQAR